MSPDRTDEGVYLTDEWTGLVVADARAYLIEVAMGMHDQPHPLPGRAPLPLRFDSVVVSNSQSRLKTKFETSINLMRREILSTEFSMKLSTWQAVIVTFDMKDGRCVGTNQEVFGNDQVKDFTLRFLELCGEREFTSDG